MKKLKIDTELIKRLKGRIALCTTVLAVAGTPFVACTYTMPDGTVVTVDENQLPTTPVDDPEIIDTTDPEPEPEVVEPVEEEKSVPDFVLLDENGDLYVPQHVTKDDFYAKIEEAEEKYNFESDWERDKFVAFALTRNSTFMDEEDICDIYQDYLANFGRNTYYNYIGIEQQDIRENKNTIPFGSYFVDPVLAEEADAFEKYLDENGNGKTSELLLEELKKIDDEDCFVNNPLLAEEMDITQCLEAYNYLPLDNNKVDYNMYCSEVLVNNNLVDISNEPTYKISEYKSSHSGFTK